MHYVFFDCDETLWLSESKDYVSSLESDFSLLSDDIVRRDADGTLFKLRPSVRKLFKELSENDEYRIGIVSDNHRKPVLECLSLFGLLSYVDPTLINIRLWDGYCPKEEMILALFSSTGRKKTDSVFWFDDKDYSCSAKKEGFIFIHLSLDDNIYYSFKSLFPKPCSI